MGSAMLLANITKEEQHCGIAAVAELCSDGLLVSACDSVLTHITITGSGP